MNLLKKALFPNLRPFSRVPQARASASITRSGDPKALVPIVRSPADGEHAEPPTPPPSRLAMFQAMDDWITSFEIDGQTVGGPIPLCNDPRLDWLLDTAGGASGKRILELGPMEGAHTKTMVERGAREVTAIEGFRPCWLRCLVVKEVFQLQQARFLYGDFCHYVANYDGPPFDFVLACGVLYHQANPARLIHDLARVTDRVLVWSHVADNEYPIGGVAAEVRVGDQAYRGKQQHYQGIRNSLKNYCGGVHPTSVWLYADELRRAFNDAGFSNITETPAAAMPHGPSVLFVASKW